MTLLFCPTECTSETREFLVAIDTLIWSTTLYLPLVSLPAFGIALMFPKLRPTVCSLAVIALGFLLVAWALITSETPLHYVGGAVSPIALVLLSLYVILGLALMAWLAIWKKSRRIFGNLALALWVLMGLFVIAAVGHIGNPNN